MTTPLRPELEQLPARIARLPIDARGYPVPWFVAWDNGLPEFRAMDGVKWRRAVQERLCWVCGERLGGWLTFVIGPMCGINRTTAEPPCHSECAIWSARNCPFLARPHMVRREDEVINASTRDESAGMPILRNPGVTLLWTTRSYTVFNDGKGKPLIQIGPPSAVEWYSQGRHATRAEVAHSVETGLPVLRQCCDMEVHEARRQLARVDLAKRLAGLERLYPLVEKTTEDILRELIVEQLSVAPDRVTREAQLQTFGMDSLDAVECAIAIEEEFGVEFSDDEFALNETFGELLEAVEHRSKVVGRK